MTESGYTYPAIRSIKEIGQLLLPTEDCQTMIIVDLDDTVKEAFSYEWKDGIRRRILPETVDAFKRIHTAGILLGIATEQAFSEIEPFLSDVTQLTLGNEHTDPYELFNGLIIGEGGNVVRRSDTDRKNAELVIVAPEGARIDRQVLLNWLQQNLLPSDTEGWSILPDINSHQATYVKLPPEKEQGKVTLSLWEQGHHIAIDPSYIARYKLVEQRIQQAIQKLGITTLKTYEAGNGTLRVVPRTSSKAHTVELLAAFGVINRNKIAYVCDGPNDLTLAQQLRRTGGIVIAVGNAVPELHALANFSAKLPAGKGFAEAINAILTSQK